MPTEWYQEISSLSCCKIFIATSYKKAKLRVKILRNINVIQNICKACVNSFLWIYTIERVELILARDIIPYQLENHALVVILSIESMVSINLCHLHICTACDNSFLWIYTIERVALILARDTTLYQLENHALVVILSIQSMVSIHSLQL